MADTDVLIKIAADVASAVKALEEMVGKLDATNKAIAAIGESSAKAKKDSEALGEFFGKQMSKAFDAAKEAVMGMSSALPNAVAHVSELGDSLLAMSQRTGLTVESLSGLRFVASQAGVSFELLGRTVQQMSKEIAEGNAKTVNTISDLGISFEELQAATPDEQFLRIMKGLKGIDDAGERTRKGVELLGPKFRQMSSLATEDIDSLMAEAKKLGLVMSEDTAKAADKYGDSLDRINKMMEATRNEVGASLLGPLTDVLDLAPQVGGALLVVGDAVLDVGKAAGSVFLNMLPQIIDKLGGWSKALDYAKGKTTELIAKILLQTGATQALAAVQAEASLGAKAYAVMQGILAIATAGVTAAVEALTVAMYENPVLAIIAGLIALGLALWGIKKHYDNVGEAAAKNAKAQMDAGKSIVEVEADVVQKEKEYQEALTKGDVLLAARLDSEIKGIRSSEEYKHAVEEYNKAIESGLEPGSTMAQVTLHNAEVQKQHNRELTLGAEAQEDMIAKSKRVAETTDAGTEKMGQFNDALKEQVRAMVLNTNASDEMILSALERSKVTADELKGLKALIAAESQQAEFEQKIAADRASMGLTGTSKQLADAKAARDAKLLSIKDKQGTDASRERESAQAETQFQVDQLKIRTSAAQSAAQSRIQLATDQRIAEVNASQQGLAAQLSIIKIRRDAEIEAAKAANDPASLALKTQEANQKAQLASENLLRDSRKKSAEDDLQQQAKIQQARIEMTTEGTVKELALIGARQAEAERVAALTLTRETGLEAELTRIRNGANLEREQLTNDINKRTAEAAAEFGRQQAEAEIKTTKFGIDQTMALRAIEWERRKAAAIKNKEDLVEVEKEFQAETARIIKEGDDTTYAGREQKAKTLRENYQKAIDAMNVTDEERHRLLMAAAEAEATALGIQFAKTKEIYAFELDQAAKKLAATIAQTGATYDQIEAAQQEYDLAVLAAEQDEKKRRALKVAFEQAKLERMKAAGKSADELLAQQKKIDEAVGYQTKVSAKNQVQIEEQKLADMLKAGSGATETQIAAQRKVVDEARRSAGEYSTAWMDASGSIAAAFEQMANVAGGSFGGVLKGVAGIFTQMKTAGTAMNQLLGRPEGSMVGPSFGMSDASMKKMSGGVAMAGQVIGGVQNFLSGTDKRSAGARALGGAQAGAQIGSIAGPWGTAIGAGVGAIVGALRKPGWVKAAKDVGRDFGTEITDELAKEIEKSAKEKFKGDRGAGALFNLDAIIGEAGGLKSGNIDKFTGKLRDVFSMVETGKFSAEQGRETLEKNFGAFADYVVKSNKVASKGFQELLTLNANSAAKSEEVIGFVSSQNQRLASGLTGLFAPLSKQIGDMVDARKKLSDAQASGKEIDLDSRLVLQESAKDIKNAGDQMQRFERLTLAGFNAAVAAGVPYLDALDQMGPALDQLSDANKKLGREGGAAINELLGIRELAKTYPELVASASSLNEVTMAMSNIGALNVDTMADLQEQGEETFGKLVEAGFSETQALQQMKGYLENVRQAHKDLGLPIDENTQLLINQAEQTGVLKKESMSTNEVMMEGFSAIIKALKGDIPAAFTKMKEAALENSKAAAAAVGHVETAVGGIDGALADSEDAFAGWSAEAIAAAQDAQAAVDAVSFGSSPGGIKEMPIKLKESIQAFKDWQKVSVGAAGAVREAIDASSGSVDGIRYAGEMSSAATADELARQQEEMISLNVAISTIDTQGMEEAVEKKMLPAISKILRKGGRNLSDIQGVLR